MFHVAVVSLVIIGCAAAPGERPRSAVALPAVDPAFPRDYAATRYFRLGEPTRLTPLRDGRTVLFLRASPENPRAALWELDVASGTTRELLRPESVVPGAEALSPEERARRERQRDRSAGFSSFETTADGATILIGLSGRLYAVTRATREVRELATGPGAAIDPHLSPDGHSVAYVRNHDVYAMTLSGGTETAVTHGGTEIRPHGVAEFMAQEEFSRSRGFWWSPDGTEILYAAVDVSQVEKWTIADPAHPETAPQITAYPRTGTPHAAVRLAIASARPGGAPPREVAWDVARYPYLTTVTWSNHAPPTLCVLDREARHGAVLAIDPDTGATRALLTEQDAAWLNVDASVPRWLPDGSGFLWSTERNGSWELELRDRSGAMVSTVARPDAGYRRLLAVDAERKVAYIAASTEQTRAEVWAAPLEGGPPRAVARLADGTVSASFGAATTVYGFFEATARGEHRFGVRTVEGTTSVAIPSLAKSPPFLPRVEYATVGPEAVRVAIVRPRAFDPQRRYPVIDNIYGMPYANVVTVDAFSYLEQQWLADTAQAIVVMIDARGTQWRGRAWERSFYGRLGSLSTEAHVDALAALARRYPELDNQRIGVYGWSGGGYSAAMAALRRPDVYKVAVAGAPAADLRDYDAIMEIFLGAPPNAAYDDASLLTWAARPPTPAEPARPLLLIHGTADDNVYFAHSLRLADAMAHAGRPVEFLPLIGETHLVGPRALVTVWLRRAEYFRRHLHSSNP